MVESSTLKSMLYRNKESKHHEYNRKNQESRIRKTPIITVTIHDEPWPNLFCNHVFCFQMEINDSRFVLLLVTKLKDEPNIIANYR
jgi:hypothetical protein